MLYPGILTQLAARCGKDWLVHTVIKAVQRTVCLMFPHFGGFGTTSKKNTKWPANPHQNTKQFQTTLSHGLTWSHTAVEIQADMSLKLNLKYL